MKQQKRMGKPCLGLALNRVGLLQHVVLCLASVLCMAQGGLVAQTGGGAAPNIVLINIDDLGSFAGYQGGLPHAFTPNINRLAAQGVQFEEAHSNAVVCAASRTSYLTGKTPEYSGIYTNNMYANGLAPDQEFRAIYAQPDPDLTVYTIPEWLKDEGGYYTLGMGKILHGWSSSFDLDLDAANADPCSRDLSWSAFVPLDPFSDPAPTAGPYNGHYGNAKAEAGPIDNAEEDGMMDTRQTTTAVQFLQAYASNPSAFCDRPFFLSLGYYRPHEPFFAPERYFDEHWSTDFYAVPYDRPYNDPPGSYPPNGNVMPPQPVPAYADHDALSLLGQRVAYGNAMHEATEAFYQAFSPLPGIESGLSVEERRAVLAESNRALVVQSYLASVAYVDAQIGRLLDALEAQPALMANTVVVLVSDHGFNLGQKKHWFKNALWDQITHIPMIVRDPRSPGGRRVSEAVSLLDLFPTLCGLAGIDVPQMPDGSPYPDGRSLLPFLTGSAPAKGAPVVSSMFSKEGEWYSCYPHYSVHTGRYHGIRYRIPVTDQAPCPGSYKDIWELYDLGEGRSVDPYEWRNLAYEEAYAPLIHWMDAWLPGGSLEGQQVPDLSIARSGESCALSPSGTIKLQARSSVSLHPDSLQLHGYHLRWMAPEAGLSKDSSSIDLPLDALPSEWFSSGKQILVYLELLDSTSTLLNMAVERIALGSAVVDPSFSASIAADGRTVELLPTEFRLSEWCFGDSICWTGAQPAPHTYTAAGNHTITRRILDEPGCSPEASQTVSTSSFAYWFSCLEPYPPQAVDSGPDALVLQLAEVEGAQDYSLRWRTRTHEGLGAWQSEPRIVALSRVLEQLPEATSVHVQAKAHCLFSSSEWSASAALQTESCLPPSALQVSASSTTAQWNWLPSMDATEGQQFVIKEFGQGYLPMVGVPTGLASASFSGLDPDTEYLLLGRSRCPNLQGLPAYNGTAYANAAFRTPEASVRHAALLGEGLLQAGLELWPNPAANGTVSVLLRSANGEPQAVLGGKESAVDPHRDQHLLIYSMQGQVLLEQRVPANVPTELSFGAWPSGSYWVEWREAGLRELLVLP